MMGKQYYVNMQTNDIHEQPIPSSIQYEIIANEEDITEIKSLFNDMDDEAKHALSYIINYVDERPVDENRESYGDNLIEIYYRIYELGTLETKLAIKEMNIFKSFE